MRLVVLERTDGEAEPEPGTVVLLGPDGTVHALCWRVVDIDDPSPDAIDEWHQD